MDEVWVVHEESGEYSDWSYVPMAAFTTRDGAVAWLESRAETAYWDGIGGCWADYPCDDERGRTATARPRTTDGRTWSLMVEGTDKRVRQWPCRSWYVEPLALDPPRDGEVVA